VEDRRLREVDVSKVHAVRPYWLPETGEWAFDDEARGLEREPFVLGASERITELLGDSLGWRGLEKARQGGFLLLFSERPFDAYQARYYLVREEGGGHVYQDDWGREAWLCPALLKFFDEAPHALYARVEALSGELLPAG
jgi:hypothetical protein